MFKKVQLEVKTKLSGNMEYMVWTIGNLIRLHRKYLFLIIKTIFSRLGAVFLCFVTVKVHISPDWSSENFPLQTIHSLSLFYGSLIYGMKSIIDDTSKWNDSLLLTLKLSLVDIGSDGRSKFNLFTVGLWIFGFLCCSDACGSFFLPFSF